MNELSTQRQSGVPSLKVDNLTRFETAMRYAQTFSRASLLPEHLRAARKGDRVVPLAPEEIEANCFLICNQALLWDIDPFSAISESYVVRGKLAFQGKLVAAVVNRELAKKLKPHYEGSGDTRQCKLVGTLKGEDEPREVVVLLKNVKTDNQMWKTDPDQKLFYTAAIKWARRHLPEVLLGISAEDDPETIDAPAVAYPAIADNGRTHAPYRNSKSSTDKLNHYVESISKATTQEELQSLVDQCQGEPTDVISQQDVERLKGLARTKWGVITQGQHQQEYRKLVDEAGSRDELTAIAEQAYADDRLTGESQKLVGDWVNKASAELDA